MDELKKEKTKTIRVSESTHKKAKDHVGRKIKLGEFADEAMLEKIQKEKSKK